MKRFAIIAALLAISAAATLWAADSLAGRDIVERGSKVSLSGILIDEGGEWSLKTAERTYAVHLGNYQILYPEGLALAEGLKASVSGFLVGEDIAAISLAVDGAEYRFRAEDGTPLWAGRGRNAGSNH